MFSSLYAWIYGPQLEIKVEEPKEQKVEEPKIEKKKKKKKKKK
jgi:hypothetical protein